MNLLALVVTSPRVAPGLLSAQAWQVLRQADEVYVSQADHRHNAPLEAAQISVSVLHGDSPAEQAAHLITQASHASVALVADEPTATVLSHELTEQLATPAQSTPAQSAPAQSDDGQPQGQVLVELEHLRASWDLPGAQLLDVVAVMDRLRSPGGCPWDAQQTHQSLVTYLLEETYELIEAIEAGSRDDMREELGDLLLQVIFHARIAQEHPHHPWSIDEVSHDITDKLRRRHRHVYDKHGDGNVVQQQMAQADPSTAEGLNDYESGWQEIKRQEKARQSVLDGVPFTQPALALAVKVLSRVSRGGVRVPLPPPPSQHHDQSEQHVSPTQRHHHIGVQLLHLAHQANQWGVDPEAALRQALRRYANQVREAEHTHVSTTLQG